MENENMQKIYLLQGGMQHYAWGGAEYLPALLKQASQPNMTYAEWWLGTHSALPSTVMVNGNAQPLAEFIAEHPQVLGKKSRAKFGDELPFLLKILDVAKPLSIQLHPTKTQAEQGFILENQQGIDPKASNRTYKDANHKPEMMVALSDFWLLHGFRHKVDIIAELKRHISLRGLAEKLETQNLHDFYADIMQADQAQLADWLLPIIHGQKQAFNEGKLPLENPDYWVLYTMQAMDIAEDKLDAGLLCFYIFNLVHLQKGEGIFQAAGIPHAYLRGQNIELMATSDNVIRGGLTPKYVNIPALLEIVDTQEITPNILPIAQTQYHTFENFVDDFTLTEVNLVQNEHIKCMSESAEILLVMSGELEIQGETENYCLSQGQSVFICADSAYTLRANQTSNAVIAKLP